MSQLENVLITGGAGFVGSHAAEYYANQGASVTAIDNLSRINTLETADESRNTSSYNWNYLRDTYPEIELIEADVRDADRLSTIVEGHDAIVHTAGQVAVTTSLDKPHLDFTVNAEGTLNILEAARQAESNPAVAFASTNKVYGGNVNEIPIREEETRYWFDDPEYDSGIPETYPIDGCEHTPYGVSKLAADLYVQDYAARNDVQAAAFRMSCIYGPRQFGNEDQGWVAHFALSTLREEPITIFGDGKQVRDVLYVKDLIRAYDAFLSDPEGKPSVFNIGGGTDNTTSLLEFLDLLETHTDTEPSVSFDDWRDGDQKVYVSDTERAKEALNWKPEVSFESGIKKYLDWYSSLHSTE
mgnify:CR=1 FL=1